jgi:hypothetical protein
VVESALSVPLLPVLAEELNAAANDPVAGSPLGALCQVRPDPPVNLNAGF